MNYVRKMVFKAMKNEKLRTYVLKHFDAMDCLPLYKDWDWGYEMSKCAFVRQALVFVLQKYGRRGAKKWFKENDARHFWYPEFQDMAKRMLKDYRRG